MSAIQHPFPGGSRCVLRNARLPLAVVDAPLLAPADSDGFIHADLLIDDGRVARIGHTIASDSPDIELDGGQVWPGCVELHTHLDKGHTQPRARNVDGTLTGAVEAVRADRLANWSAQDVEKRFEFSLRCAYAHGTVAMRTHIDSYPPQAPISWPVFRQLRERWAGRIALQGVSMAMLSDYEGDAGAELADLVADAGGILGGVTRVAGPAYTQTPERIEVCLDRLFCLASERKLDIDLHTDETPELEPNTLKLVALAALRNRFRGRVVCGHCCSLSLRSDQDARQTIDLVKEAGLSIVTLPMVNSFLQGRRFGQTPRWRGVTLLHELAAAGVPVAASSDNCRDPMYPYGDFDPIEVFRETVKICQLDLDCSQWLPLITRSPADIMGLPSTGRIAIGAPADLILLRARSMSEMFARPQHGRIVLRGGRSIPTDLPDFRELDPAGDSA